ncbi:MULTISPECIES: ribosome recycling factor [Acetoanaerobium]|jgi:ribosome recycling factor|uniref:Ribosome-recycling factor n=1 Tax=Acetoanaerobium sticklandii (strain ATCC 12662 / DSM 519 / JCM 1433 / CCUG 9281 / NCIMB 10654 / HF) TaxID=499177 RepID=E3PSG8_ACESD|nr:MULTISPECIES: ribosome recycling factor [Acetoanaerobium]MBP8762337.1 ribosome recycling factor [Acetoanaerobium sp.]MDK2803713.1 ribosome recycling factor [Peptostreptococcaceae bacterium]MBP9499380.1 ribosome recycling factor [Acetoanaerobium sp.]MBP9561968.1 ribosome recycling factor [Acetoanaerobium sp.]CBH21822.1 ribosome recycling factor [Acetoanaerobium sticklandii]
MKLDIHKKLEEKMEKTIAVLKDELLTIRAGRANPNMLDRVMVDYYGTMTPLKQMAGVSSPEPRTILIQPWDKSAMGSIEKAILSSDLGFNPTNDGNSIRINIPQLTEERRKDLIKLVAKTGEQAKVAIRNERREANEAIKKMEKTSELTEDDSKKAQDEVQKLTDSHIKMIDDMLAKKEKDIMEV